MGEATAYIVSPDEETLPSRVCVGLCDARGDREVQQIITDDGEIEFEAEDVRDVEFLLVAPREPGFWATYCGEFEDAMTIVCERLSGDNTPGWWLRLLGPAADDPDRGSRMRVGVVDAHFEPTAGLEHVEVVTPELSRPRQRKATGGMPHGEAVCRIIGDGSAPAVCRAIAPGAELCFSSGSFSHAATSTDHFLIPHGEKDVGGELDPVEVANAIVSLAADHEVDIINLSLGTFNSRGRAASGLVSAIDVARALGTVVVCAAGNEFVSGAAFPACRKECIGVGALGKFGWGARSSLARQMEVQVQPHKERRGFLADDEVYHSPESAYGEGVDLIAPGVGVIVSQDGAPAYDLTGTSFAAPIVSGMLAVALAGDDHYLGMARDVRRTEYAERALETLCMSANIEKRFEGWGVPSL